MTGSTMIDGYYLTNLLGQSCFRRVPTKKKSWTVCDWSLHAIEEEEEEEEVVDRVLCPSAARSRVISHLHACMAMEMHGQ
jgi:hypothetical protein